VDRRKAARRPCLKLLGVLRAEGIAGQGASQRRRCASEGKLFLKERNRGERAAKLVLPNRIADNHDVKVMVENGPLQLNADASLWRYVSLPALLLYLDGRLRLRSISDLQCMDKLEGALVWSHITQAVAFSTEEYRELANYVYSNLSSLEQGSWRLNATDPSENQRVAFDSWHRLISSTRYSLCFFRAEHESIAMWRLYAPQGFAIRTSLNSLSKALANTGREWRISRMKYRDKSEEITPDEIYADQELRNTLRRPFLLKSHEYEYENEVRLFTVDGRARPSLLVENVAPGEWIEQIRVSPEVWPEDAELLRLLIRERAPSLEGRIGLSPLADATDPAKSARADLQSDVFLEDAKNKWPRFLWNP
jgi:Protein of unknown function (DUF2971)